MLFNPSPPYVMMLDINSCFATVEQQANPLIRGKPVVVGAYTTNRGCVLAASREAKLLGIKTGMYVGDAKRMCPSVVVLPPDPPKYRFINKALYTLLSSYTASICIKSIDEMVLNFWGSPKILVKNSKLKVQSDEIEEMMKNIALEIKDRIKREIGEWMTVSIGIAPNQYLAKVGSGYQKPDGLIVVTQETIGFILGSMELTDLCGIKKGYGKRLRRHGITTPLAMLQASPQLLAKAFQSRVGYDWWARLHGWGTSAHAWDSWENSDEEAKTIGHSYALPAPYVPSDGRLHQILCQLAEKMARRMRKHDFCTHGIHVSCYFADHTSWGHGEKQKKSLFAGDDIYAIAKQILLPAPDKPVRILAVTSYALTKHVYAQQSLFENDQKKERLTQAVDVIERRWGDFTLFPGRMLGMEQKVLDRIAFGGGKELMKVTIQQYDNTTIRQSDRGGIQ